MTELSRLRNTDTSLVLSMALPDNHLCRPIANGQVTVNGVRPIVSLIHPSEIFWRQLRFSEFDVSDMSLSTLLISHALGRRDWVALPIFSMRRFFHTGVLVRPDAGIATPADLKGKRVGVPEYQQTAAIWARGILQHHFGVDPRDIHWFMERNPDRSHGASTQFRPPAGVRLEQIPPSSSMGEMLMLGTLDASLLYLNEPNLVDRSHHVLGDTVVRPLFPDPEGENRRFFAETGIYPVNHALVVRRSLMEAHPWLALNLYSAFVEAKEQVRAQAREVLQPYFETGLLAPDVVESLDQDPMPYGFQQNLPILTMISRFVHEQGLIDRPIDPVELFAEQTLTL